jgi:hypothetical protein
MTSDFEILRALDSSSMSTTRASGNRTVKVFTEPVSVDRTGAGTARVAAGTAGAGGLGGRTDRAAGDGEDREEPVHARALAVGTGHASAPLPTQEALEAGSAVAAVVFVDRHAEERIAESQPFIAPLSNPPETSVFSRLQRPHPFPLPAGEGASYFLPAGTRRSRSFNHPNTTTRGLGGRSG